MGQYVKIHLYWFDYIHTAIILNNDRYAVYEENHKGNDEFVHVEDRCVICFLLFSYVIFLIFCKLIFLYLLYMEPMFIYIYIFVHNMEACNKDYYYYIISDTYQLTGHLWSVDDIDCVQWLNLFCSRYRCKNAVTKHRLSSFAYI